MPTANGTHLAQINVARLVAPIDDPRISEFVAQLDTINALAERSDGFVWRLQSERGNATDIPYCDDPFVLVNMSVWESLEAQRRRIRARDNQGKLAIFAGALDSAAVLGELLNSAEGIYLQIGACCCAPRPCQMVREDGQAELLFVVDTHRSHPDGPGRFGTAYPLPDTRRDATFVLVQSGVSGETLVTV